MWKLSTGSFSSRSYAACIEQPNSGTGEIARLYRLFERTRNGTTTTVKGRELLLSAMRVLEEVDGFVSKSRTLSGAGLGTYRLGVTPTLGPYLLPHILTPIHAQYENLQLYVREEAPRDLEAGLLERRHDFILSTQPITSKELSVFLLFREPLKFALSREHRLQTNHD